MVSPVGRYVVKNETIWLRNVKSCVPTSPKPSAFPMVLRTVLMSPSRKLIADCIAGAMKAMNARIPFRMKIPMLIRARTIGPKKPPVSMFG